MGTHTAFSCGWEGRDRWEEMGKTDSGLRVGLELAVLARQLLPDRLHFFFFFLPGEIQPVAESDWRRSRKHVESSRVNLYEHQFV